MTPFRPATDGDIDAILPMMRGFYAEDGYPFSEPDSRRALQRLIRDDRLGGLWVALEGGAVCGYLAVTLGYSLEWRGQDAFVDELFIAEPSRGRGLGRAALALAEEFCRSRGVRALHLEVEPHRERAYRLYQEIGFEDHERRLMTKIVT